MISVICPTNRIGGLDVLFDSLAAQTYRDFELIVVDNIGKCRARPLYESGHRHLNTAPKNRATQFLSVLPRSNPFPRVAYCESMNTGIAHARGETLVFLCDYSWLHPDCLATHAAEQAREPGPLHLDYDYCELPKLKSGLPFYGQKLTSDAPGYLAELNATTDRYCADLASGKLDPFMWSIFAERPTQASVEALHVTHKHRPCATRKLGDWNFCSFKNESFPTELLLEMNGLNEALDESHCYQDQEFSYRLRTRGIEWVTGPAETGMVTVLNPREVLNVKRLAYPIAHNRRVAETFKGPVNPGWSLREWRAEVLG